MYVGPYVIVSKEFQCLVMAKMTGHWVVMFRLENTSAEGSSLGLVVWDVYAAVQQE